MKKCPFFWSFFGHFFGPFLGSFFGSFLWEIFWKFSREILRTFFRLLFFWTFFLKYFSLWKRDTLTYSDAGRSSDALFIIIMSSSSSYKRAVARQRAFSRSSDIVCPPVTPSKSPIYLKLNLTLESVLSYCMFRFDHPPLLTSAKRCMWVNALPDSTRRLCLATKTFSSKRRK